MPRLLENSPNERIWKLDYFESVIGIILRIGIIIGGWCKNYQGEYSGNIDTRSFATGVYALNIQIGETTHKKNITVLH